MNQFIQRQYFCFEKSIYTMSKTMGRGEIKTAKQHGSSRSHHQFSVKLKPEPQPDCIQCPTSFILRHEQTRLFHYTYLNPWMSLNLSLWKNKDSVSEQFISIHLKTINLPPLPWDETIQLARSSTSEKANHHLMKVCGGFPFNMQRAVKE